MNRFLVYASGDFRLFINENGLLAELKVFIGKQIQIKTEVFYNQEQFDVIVVWHRM